MHFAEHFACKNTFLQAKIHFCKQNVSKMFSKMHPLVPLAQMREAPLDPRSIVANPPMKTWFLLRKNLDFVFYFVKNITFLFHKNVQKHLILFYKVYANFNTII
ncbi:MAG: hypothetical protein EOP65_06360 [Sphingomonas sp.]|nr:MAG: hypothetical protein EOP65_06360 [Sphingomonas sp.]